MRDSIQQIYVQMSTQIMKGCVWEIQNLHEKQLSLMLLTAITSEGTNEQWKKKLKITCWYHAMSWSSPYWNSV